MLLYLQDQKLQYFFKFCQSIFSTPNAVAIVFNITVIIRYSTMRNVSILVADRTRHRGTEIGRPFICMFSPTFDLDNFFCMLS